MKYDVIFYGALLIVVLMWGYIFLGHAGAEKECDAKPDHVYVWKNPYYGVCKEIKR